MAGPGNSSSLVESGLVWRIKVLLLVAYPREEGGRATGMEWDGVMRAGAGTGMLMLMLHV